MLDLNDLYYFATLAERGSLTAAAEMLGVPKGSLSRRLQNLEAQLDLRLIDRTTRRFALTEAGEALYLYARQIVEHAQAAESNLRSLLGEPTGRVRMTCPQGILRTLLVPLLPEFLALYPKLNVAIVASSRYVDLIADGLRHGAAVIILNKCNRNAPTTHPTLHASNPCGWVSASLAIGMSFRR